jgi:serine/threonine-protein kinase
MPPPEPSDDPLVGTVIDGRYAIEAVLGAGGMGIVYRARHVAIQKALAVKVLRADFARDVEMTQRFVREARAASAIGNPHIVDISDFGVLPDGSTYFVMEYPEGQPLGALLHRGGPIPVPRLLRIAEQCTDALAAAHRRGIVHRDLKPDNVFVVNRGSVTDFVKILDFGIAKVSSGGEKLTRFGAIFGTPHYMSPEQATGLPVDHRSDIYSFGVILHEMASGEIPFDAETMMSLLGKQINEPARPLRERFPERDLPAGLDAIVMKCLAKRPDERFASMEELHEALGALVRELAGDGPVPARTWSSRPPPARAEAPRSSIPVAVPAAPEPLPEPRPRRGRAYAVVGAVLAFGALIFGSAAVLRSVRSNPPAVAASHATLEPPLASAPVRAPAAPATAPPAAHARSVRNVIVVTIPVGAEVTAGGKSLGPGPVSVGVPEGETVTVTVGAPGFAESALTLDGAERDGRVEVVLRRATARPERSGKTAASASAGAPASGSAVPPAPQPAASPADPGIIADPWGGASGGR